MHKRANVTLKTVAATAGCSIAVASTVLNGSRGNTKVSDPMRRKILGLAAELGYHPNSASQMLKTRRSTTLGIYVQPKSWRSLSNDYEMAIFRGVEQAARDRNYNLLVLNISSRNLPDICAEKIAESRIDGVILIHSDSNAEWVDRLLRVSSNVVAIDQPAEQFGLSRVVFDNRAAVELAVKTLLELGHRRIGFIADCTTHGVDSRLREDAFLDCVRQGIVDADPALLFNRTRCKPLPNIEERYCELEGERGFRYLMSLPEPPTAIITYNSLVGVSVLREARRAGIEVPRDLSVIGIDYCEFTNFIDPTLSVIDHVLTEMGRAGTEMLIDLIEQKISAPALRSFSPLYRPGNSVAPPR
ncbi:LacI family DNA-binding transcriptional regulator [uncultured Victivallis sp.]|uniref:LacI family DNA-binding transcriptional regulator n=1 Tax=uncultured Victivallis sp. TaxID=354118 RepID=UPI0025D64921|nr:LacI family DNA-binding transcriptional regulator [uncultured Victivallis sp.]